MRVDVGWLGLMKNISKLRGSHEQWFGTVIGPFTARVWTHTASQNVTGEETVYGRPGIRTDYLSHTARAIIPPHGRPATISLCLIRFIPETMLKSWIQCLCCPQLNMDQQWATKGKRGIVNDLSSGWGSNQCPSASKSKSRTHRYKRWLVPLGSSSVLYIYHRNIFWHPTLVLTVFCCFCHFKSVRFVFVHLWWGRLGMGCLFIALRL